MSHPFGELLKQYRRRKPGLSQERLAHRIGYDEAVLVRMSQGKKDLTGPSGRDRVIRLIEALHDEGTLHTQAEANALLAAAALPPLYTGIPAERRLLQILRSDVAVTVLPMDRPSSLRYTLPASVASFVGRERDIAEVTQRFKSARLLTLTGAGGSGKTRLALVAATQQTDGFRHGACFVGLATVRQTKDVLPAIALALNVRESPDMPLLDSVKHFLSSKSLLLLIDNFEHVLECAPMITDILMAAPNLKVMATSREPLRLTGEYIYGVEPLPLDHAIELFTQRAEAVKPGFRVTADLEPIIADICRRLDCLPLALELAAARMRQFSPTRLLTDFNQQRSLTLLNDAPRDVPTRHRTLWDAIAWSYALLSPSEKQVLCTLSVFIGGGEIEQIERVFTNIFNGSLIQPATATELQSLVDKSLVRAIEQPDGSTRHMMLELIREFVLDQLQVQGTLTAIRQAHAEVFLQLARDGTWGIRSHAQLFWHDRIERDYPNFREALAWSLDQAGNVFIGCQLVEALGYFWFIATRYLAETRAWILKALAAKTNDMPSDLLGGLCACIIINGHLWDFPRWVEVGREGLLHFSKTNNLVGIATVKYGLGAALIGLDPHSKEGLQVIHECLALCRETGNKWTESHAIHVLAIYYDEMKDRDMAEKLYREMIDIRRELDNPIEVSIGLWQLADVVARGGRLDEANGYLEESSILARQFDSPQDVLHAECALGNNLRRLGKLDRAAETLEACVTLARNRLPPDDLVDPLILMSRVEVNRGHPHNSLAALSEAIQIVRRLNWPNHFPAWRYILDGFAMATAMQSSPEISAKLWGAADRFWESIPSSRSDLWIGELAAYRTSLKQFVSDDVCAAAYAEGRAMSLDQAIELALSL